jgi:hypothetical protein
MDEPNILIKTALADAVQKVNSGMSPTTALKKVANDMDLNPNYMQRTGEALNVALHYKHFKTAADRSIDFEIADIPKAIEDVFSTVHKTAAEQISESFSTAAADEPVFNYSRILSNPVYKQAFLEISGASETHDSFPTTFNTVYEKSANYIQKLSKQSEEAAVAKVAAEITLNDKFSVLCDEFKKDAAYRATFEEFESQVFAKHGSAAVPYLDLLHKTACVSEERGVHDSGYMMFDSCKEAGLFDEVLQAAAQMLESEKTAGEITESLKFESSYLKECHAILGKTAAKTQEASHEKAETVKEETREEETSEEEDEDPVMAAVKKKASDANYSVAPRYDKDPVVAEALEKGAFLGSLTNMMSSLVQEPLQDAFNHSFKGTNHQHTGIKPNLTLDNMERRLLLQELMLTDPILSKINPAKVARAFEQILRLSPEISKQKEVVRAELRAMVASQALSKYDAEMMTKLDVGMLKSRVATQQFNKGLTDHFKV